jgi:hypothetical protein
MASQCTRHATSPGNSATDVLPEVAVIDCQQPKTRQDVDGHDVTCERKFDAPLSSQDMHAIQRDSL